MQAKKKPGRPIIGAAAAITIHLTPKQHKKLLLEAIDKNVSISSLIRKLVDRAYL